jgi:hypothetical protein
LREKGGGVGERARIGGKGEKKERKKEAQEVPRGLLRPWGGGVGQEALSETLALGSRSEKATRKGGRDRRRK